MKRRRTADHVLTAACLCLLIGGCSEESAPPSEPGPIDDRLLAVPGNECGQCHVAHYDEWQGSMHAYAGTDPVWYAINSAGQDDTGGQLDQFCVGCHMPAAQQAGLTAMPLHRSLALARPLIRDGVGCGFCHSIDRYTGISNQEASFVLAPDRTAYGTIANPQSTPFHRAEVRSGMSNSAFCGTCHEVINNDGVTIESTYSEWSNSPYNALRIHCQDCHMPEYQGQATNSSPVRTLHRHRFVGVDVALENFPDRDEQIAAVAELLAGAATLEIRGTADADSVWVTARVENVGTGHDLPSGTTAERQLWIELHVEDGGGAPLFASGELDANGDLKDHHSEIEPDADRQLALWNSVLLDATGRETHFMWQARSQPSRRIPAGEAGEVTYRLPRPQATLIRVRAQLHFRALPAYTLRERSLNDRLPFLPVFTIGESELTIPLSRRF